MEGNHKRSRLIRVFLSSASCIFFVSGGAKIVSVIAGGEVLQTLDPIVGMRLGNLFSVVGVAELMVAAVCLLGKRARMQAGLVLWVGMALLLYRIGLAWVGIPRTCGCLGSVTAALGVPVVQADQVMKALLLYLLVGSTITLWRLRSAAVPADRQQTRPASQ